VLLLQATLFGAWWWAGCGFVIGMDELYEADMADVWGTVQVASPSGYNTTTCTWEFDVGFFGRTAKVSDNPTDPWANPDWYVGGTLTNTDSSWQNTFSGACNSTMVIYHDNSFARDPAGVSDTWTAFP
jgi:hypothetical protein